MKNTEQGEGAEIRSDEMSLLEHETEWKARQAWYDAGCPPLDAWEDVPGVPPPTGEELDEMARYFGE